MSRDAVLVLGPESSGTRLMTRILIAAGCHGQDGHHQEWDRALPEDGRAPIVWRRSFPHGGQWPDIVAMSHQLRQRGYVVKAVVLAREPQALERSQVAAGHVGTVEEARWHLQRAYQRIMTGLTRAEVEYILVPYEALVLHPAPVQAYLARRLDLPASPHVAVYDGNAKWYA